MVAGFAPEQISNLGDSFEARHDLSLVCDRWLKEGHLPCKRFRTSARESGVQVGAGYVFASQSLLRS
jgi:hypothetical protein